MHATCRIKVTPLVINTCYINSPEVTFCSRKPEIGVRLLHCGSKFSQPCKTTGEFVGHGHMQTVFLSTLFSYVISCRLACTVLVVNRSVAFSLVTRQYDLSEVKPDR
jgi:hypothetical protein